MNRGDAGTGDAGAKICVFCGQDCAGQPRGKDPKGRYYHTACRESAHATKPPVVSRAAAPSRSRDVPDISGWDDLGLDLSAAEGNAAVGACPQCAHPMAQSAVICVHCGFNRATGEQLPTAPVVAPRPALAGAGGPGWPLVIGVICLVVAAIDIGMIIFNSMSYMAIEDSQPEGQGMGGVKAIASAIIPGLIALWLVLGSLGLLQRSSTGVKRLRQWAFVKIFIGLVCGGIALVGISAIEGAAEEFARDQSVEDLPIGVLKATLIIGMIWAVAFPAFLLIWFKRPAIAAEIARW